MGDLGLDLLRERKVGLARLKLPVDLVDGDAVVDEGKEARRLSRLDQLSCNLLLSRLKVYLALGSALALHANLHRHTL